MSSSTVTPSQPKKEKIRILPAKRKHRHEIKSINELTLPENYPMDLWEEILSEHCSFVLMANSKMIGYCCVARNSVMSFAILSEYRGRGFGKLLMNTTLDCLKSKKWTYITLHVRVDNVIAQKLYLSVGFQIHETVVKYYDTIDGYKMKKML
ncbi:MAG: GNAT family N-acetyltransferase [Candidatus Colwellbacteria bacterium]|nr:GNAT family N-acetyltransferase [Candidatus Colwellbacteria bacterium]